MLYYSWVIKMSRIEKLLDRLLCRPTDFTFEEAALVLKHFGFVLVPAGKTGGSRVAFAKDSDYIRMHKPHPRNILKGYQVVQLIDALKERGHL